jgi:Tol biopolymer transport system component
LEEKDLLPFTLQTQSIKMVKGRKRMKSFRESMRKIAFQAMINKKLLLIAMLFVLVSSLVGCEQPAMSKILFTRQDDSGEYIYIMDADGNNQRSLDRGEYPCWSPDGKKIAFVSTRDGNREIYIMDADGSDLINLSNNPACDDKPLWLPGGKKIIFNSNRGGQYGLYIMDADGSNQTKLPYYSGGWTQYTWSPDGKKIAFQCWREGAQNIWVVDIETGKEIQLTCSTSRDGYPIWSPDGREIAFTSERDGHEEIYLMDADGNNLRRLTTYSGIVPERWGMIAPGYHALAWFPDSDKILAWLFDYGTRRWDLYSINKEGKKEINLTHDISELGGYPVGSCSPDGSKVVFSIALPRLPESGGFPEVWVVNADGSDLTRLTYNQASDEFPSWQPR